MFFVYLLASKPHGTLYLGSTSDLVRRIWEHKVKAVPGFTAKYGVDCWFGSSITTHWKQRCCVNGGSRVGSAAGKSG
jgi:hypothetical protein